VVALDQGDFDLARARFEEHLGNARNLGDRKLASGALGNLSMVAYNVGDLQLAGQLGQEALDLAEQVGDRRAASAILINLGLVAHARRDYPAARSLHLRSLELAEALGERRGMAESLEELAQVEVRSGNAHLAVVLIGASAALRETIGAPVPGPDLARLSKSVEEARRELGAGQFAAAHDAGRAMSIIEAAQYARGRVAASAAAPASAALDPRPAL